MNEDGVRDFYGWLNKRWVTPAARLGMGSPTLQRKSFQQVLDFTERYYTLCGKSIHDAGCGHGAFYPHAKQRGVSSYIGTELREEAVAEGNRLFPDAPKKVLNLLTDELPRADITFLNGVLAGWDCDDSMRMVEKALAASSTALVFYHWMNTPEGNRNKIEADLFQQAMDTLLETNRRHTASARFNLSREPDRIIIISHNPLV